MLLTPTHKNHAMQSFNLANNLANIPGEMFQTKSKHLFQFKLFVVLARPFFSPIRRHCVAISIKWVRYQKCQLTRQYRDSNPWNLVEHTKTYLCAMSSFIFCSTWFFSPFWSDRFPASWCRRCTWASRRWTRCPWPRRCRRWSPRSASRWCRNRSKSDPSRPVHLNCLETVMNVAS